MKKNFFSAAIGIMALTVLVPLQPVAALEAYSPQEQQQFMDWCTGAKSATESTCSCTVKKIALTVPAAALSQFLASQGSFSLSATAVSTGAVVTQALLSCSNG